MRSAKPCCRNDAASWNPAWPAPTIRTVPCVIPSGGYDAQRQGVKPAQRVVQPPRRFARQFERRDAPGERPEDRLAFKPGHRLADAAMNTGAEGHVSGGAAPDVELLRIFPTARVTIGGGEEQQDLLTIA